MLLALNLLKNKDYPEVLNNTKKYVLIMTSTILLSGCAGLLPGTVNEDVRLSRVIDKSAWDLECPKDQLFIQKLNDTTYGAKGCGKKATYVMSHCVSGIMAANWASVCTAVLNSDITSVKI